MIKGDLYSGWKKYEQSHGELYAEWQMFMDDNDDKCSLNCQDCKYRHVCLKKPKKNE